MLVLLWENQQFESEGKAGPQPTLVLVQGCQSMKESFLPLEI